MNPVCPQCHQTTHLLFRTPDRNRRITHELFSYYRCATCSLIFLHPIPEDLGQYYPNEYYSIEETRETLAAAVSFERRKLDFVQPFVTSGRLLEIGPAQGVFAYAAKQAGFEVETIEMDKECCRFIEDVLGINAVNSADISGSLASMGSYDVIALWHVFEHLIDPWSALTSIAQHLTPKGILVIAVPNPDSFQFRLLRSRWPHVDAPRHISLVPIALLTDKAHRLGLKPILRTSNDPGGRYLNTFGWQKVLDNALPGPMKPISQLVGRVISGILRPIERSGLRGSAYTVVFQHE